MGGCGVLLPVGGGTVPLCKREEPRTPRRVHAGKRQPQVLARPPPPRRQCPCAPQSPPASLRAPPPLCGRPLRGRLRTAEPRPVHRSPQLPQPTIHLPPRTPPRLELDALRLGSGAEGVGALLSEQEERLFCPHQSGRGAAGGDQTAPSRRRRSRSRRRHRARGPCALQRCHAHAGTRTRQ
eukprot:scaffold14805_cov121-Isochrysis_galbana.AAC.3